MLLLQELKRIVDLFMLHKRKQAIFKDLLLGNRSYLRQSGKTTILVVLYQDEKDFTFVPFHHFAQYRLAMSEENKRFISVSV